jgi:hypothetical protein
LDALDRFGLPASVVAARWRGWELFGPSDRRRQWKSGRTQGVVLDFAALRHWLVAENAQMKRQHVYCRCLQSYHQSRMLLATYQN